jgi:hypothetical protein
MFRYQDIQARLHERPFRPFRIIAGEGQRFEIHHPDSVLVGQRDLMIGFPSSEHPSVYDGVTRVALVHVVALEDSSSFALPPNNGPN